MFIWSEVICAPVVRFRPTSRVVSQIYRERTMDKLRTNEKPLTSWSNKFNLEKPDQTSFEHNSVFKMVSLISQTRQTFQTGFYPCHCSN